ncbi:MAG: sigma-E processing peptidase SpoIIGA [Marvinbryantia sp.]
MYFEFYLDIYFLENLIMNYLVMDMTGRVLQLTPSRKRMLTAAVLGAMGACAVIVTPIHKNLLLNVIYGFGICPVMARTAFGKKKGAAAWNRNCAAYVVSMTLGCLWQFLRGTGLPFGLTISVGWLMALILIKLYRRSAGYVQYLYETELRRGEKSVHLISFLDSGNHLYQPGSQKPVHILDYSQICALLTEAEKSELDALLDFQRVESPSGVFCYIPYRALGNKRGMLPAIRLDEIRITRGENVKNTKGILAAVSKEAVSSRGSYQMILHPQILE